MASMPAYAFASLPLALLGLWHFISCCRAYLKSPTNFSAKSWHPCTPPLRFLELYIELLAFLIAIAYQSISLSTMPHASFAQIIAFQQLALCVFFFLSLLLTLTSETTGALPLPSEAFFLLLGLAFCAEYMVLKQAIDSTLELERECFDLQGILAAVCAGCCFLLAWRSKAFLVNMVLSVCISLQGTWLLQIGFSLFTDFALPEGCHRLRNGSTQCDVDAAKTRAVALMDLVFMVHVVGSVFFFAFIYGLLSRTVGYKRNGGYEFVDTNGESDHLQMKPLSTKVVID